jgi:hypothetical protein
MSLPPLARWGFNIQPEPGSQEMDLARFLQPHDWADLIAPERECSPCHGTAGGGSGA